MKGLRLCPESFVLTRAGFRKIVELSGEDRLLGLRHPTRDFDWRCIEVTRSFRKSAVVRIITDKNEITLDPRVKVKVIRDEKTILVKAGDSLLGDFLEIEFYNEEYSLKGAQECVLTGVSKEKAAAGWMDRSVRLVIDKKTAYLLGVLQNAVEGLPGNLTLRVWGEPCELLEYGNYIQKLLYETSQTLSQDQDVALSYLTSFEVEEGPRYSWLIFSFRNGELPWYIRTLLEYSRDGVVPAAIRRAEEEVVRAFLSGMLDVRVEFDEFLETSCIIFSKRFNETRRFFNNYLNLYRVYSAIANVLSQYDPWEVRMYLDMSEVIEKCRLETKRPLTTLAAKMGLGEYHKNATLLPQIRAKTFEYGPLCSVPAESLWKPIVEWTAMY